MMGRWLNRNNPVIERKPKVEHGVTFSSLENHWKQAVDVMQGNLESPSDAALIVISHLSQMIEFLRVSQTDDPDVSCKKFWILNKCSEKVIMWLHNLQIQGLQLCNEDERKLVQTLQALCELAARDEELLGYVSKDVATSSSAASASWDGACSLSSLLLEYSLKSDPYLGEPARNSFIHLIKLASKYPPLQETFCRETGLGLTNVVISGLSACFAQLPTFTSANSVQLEPFITQLQFVDAVTHAAPLKVSLAVADCFQHAFLHAVILPALTQDEGNRSMHKQDDQFITSLHEEIAVVTSYLKIVCEQLSHPALIKSLLMFITSSSNLLKIFTQRINHPNVAVTVSTLGLLSTLLEFYCEDFWYKIVLQYLMPQNHLIVSQRFSLLPEIDYQEASVRFLSLIPAQILDVMGPEAITFHYTQYLTNELSRWSSFDEVTFSVVSPVVSTIDEKSTKNSVFPFWKFRYDGTDAIVSNEQIPPQLSREANISPELKKTNENEQSDNSLERTLQSLPQNSNDQQEVVTEDPLSAKPKFTNIPLHPSLSLDEQMNSLGISEPSLTNDPSYEDNTTRNLSDGYGSLESNGINGIVTENQSSASFGPFLDTLFLHLNNLHQLPPDVILMVTDIISILAASRIPLLRSILLDPNLILQPSYTPFTLVLNRVRVEMENCLRGNLPLINEVWNVMNKNNFYTQTNMRSPKDSIVSSLSNTLDATTDQLMRRISNSSSFSSIFNTVLHKRTGGETSSSFNQPNSSANTSFTTSHNDSSQSVPSSRYPPTKGSPSSVIKTQNTPQSPEAIKLAAERAIYFSHWLLELGAIAQQLCWKRPIV